jgi:uncharacterized protein (DUF1684 family)
MKSNQILKIFGAVVLVIIILYSFLPGERIPYQELISNHRDEINDFMENDPDSPLADSLKPDFRGLQFFPANQEFKVTAKLETVPGNPTLVMATSDGETREYIKYAYAYFELGNKENRLTLLQAKGDDSDNLFLPFTDLSSGVDTYGGGRYLDLELTDNNRITIDFNLAYNPYCVYSEAYSCPLPPAENQLSIAIEAGEKNFF